MTTHHLSSGEDREALMEELALNAGLAQYRERSARLDSKGLTTLTDYGSTLLKRSIEPLIIAIKDFLEQAGKAPGRKHTAYHLLSQVEPDVAAFLTVRQIFDSITQSVTYQSCASGIASRIEEELRWRSFEQQAPALFNKVKKNLKEHPIGYQDRVKRSMMSHAAMKFNVQWSRWNRSDKIHFGSKLIDLFMEATKLVQLSRKKSHKDTTIYLAPAPELLERIASFKERSELMCPQLLPMVCPPRPWTTPTNGGYLNQTRFPHKLVKTSRKSYMTELKHRDMDTVYKAINSLQDTAWRVSPAMWTVIQEIWNAGVEVKGLPSQFDLPLPPRPEMPPKGQEPSPEQLATYRQWKRGAAAIFRKNQKDGSKRMQIGKVLYVAGKFSEFPAIWFPSYLDFRGRMYALPKELNPQGCDLAKGLLTFAEGKPLGKTGIFWLGVHVANTFGFDKASLQERYEWAVQNSERIFSTVNEPLSDRWWMEADKPFQFLAAAIEWVGQMTDGGENYVCSLPIMVDGSCNGLQHFSAMLRDEIAGQHVNLIPRPKPADIYQAVADAVVVALKADSEKGTEFAVEWLNYGVSRKMAKRPVMVLPYGGTMSAVLEYITQAVDEATEAGRAHPFGEKLAKAIGYLSRVFWKTMGEVVVGPRVAMDWLRDCVKVINKSGVPVQWTTPAGFLVQQAYADRTRTRIKTKIGDEIVYVSILENKETLDTRRQVQAISPNFVHSLDAAALSLTIVSAGSRGVTQFAAIHDSYGTLAADMQVLMDTLRECFVSMYETNDVLAQFFTEVAPAAPEGKKLPPMPARGNLDLHGVLKSDFFFA